MQASMYIRGIFVVFSLLALGSCGGESSSGGSSGSSGSNGGGDGSSGDEVQYGELCNFHFNTTGGSQRGGTLCAGSLSHCRAQAEEVADKMGVTIQGDVNVSWATGYSLEERLCEY